MKEIYIFNIYDFNKNEIEQIYNENVIKMNVIKMNVISIHPKTSIKEEVIKFYKYLKKEVELKTFLFNPIKMMIGDFYMIYMFFSIKDISFCDKTIYFFMYHTKEDLLKKINRILFYNKKKCLHCKAKIDSEFVYEKMSGGNSISFKTLDERLKKWWGDDRVKFYCCECYNKILLSEEKDL